MSSIEVDLNKRSFLSEKRKVAYLISMLFWPFGVLLISMRHRNERIVMNIFWMFCIFIGLTFVITSDVKDSAIYAKMLHEFHVNGVTVGEIIGSTYGPDHKYVDAIQPLITAFVASFTDNPVVLFTIFGLIFGFFYSRNIWYLLDRVENRLSIVSFVYILVFMLINPIWNLNGFRMYAASQVFVYGLLPYLVEGKTKKLWWAAASVLFHFSFIFPVGIFALYYLIKNRINFYFILFIVTSFINAIDLDAVRDYLSFLPDVFDSRIETYTDAGYARDLSQRQAKLHWYVPLSGDVVTYTVYVFVVYIYIQFKESLKDYYKALFCFSTLFYSWANLASLVPSGGRFIALGNLFMIFLIILFIQEHKDQRKLKLISIASIPGLSLFILVAMRLGFDYISMSTLLGNPILALFYHDETPLISYVKSLF